MILYYIIMIGICLIYGWILAELIGGDNYNNVWIWTSYILFIINDFIMKCLSINRNDEE